jgi:hypothetical protein
MAKVVHIFKSCRPIFLFELFALLNLAFGPNQNWIRFGIKLNFKYTRADSSASTPCPLPWPTCQFPLCRCHALLPPVAPLRAAHARAWSPPRAPHDRVRLPDTPRSSPFLLVRDEHRSPPFSSVPRCWSRPSAPPLPIASSVLPLLFEAAPWVTSSLLTAGSPSPPTEGPLCIGIVRWSRHHFSHGEHRRYPCHFTLFFKLFPP